MLFSCLPSDARIPGRFPGPPHPRGKHFTVDIHCHVLTEAAEAMFRAPVRWNAGRATCSPMRARAR